MFYNLKMIINNLINLDIKKIIYETLILKRV